MNPRIKQLWLDALRSGDYAQGTGALKAPSLIAGNADEYCCLGVLCDLHAKETRSEWGLGSRHYLGVCGYLPKEVVEWAELSGHSRLRKEPGPDTGVPIYDINIDSMSGDTLTSYNDNDGASFTDIAAVIEERV
jgi:hypothetical protein